MSPASSRAARWALAAAITSIVLWASAFVAIRFVGRELSPGPLTLGRLLLGTLALGLFAAVRGELRPPANALPRLIICGLLWFAAYNLLLNAAEQRIDAGTAAMLVNVNTLLVAVMAGLFLGEGFPRFLMIGTAVGFMGAVLIGLGTGGESSAALEGTLLGLAAALAWALSTLAQKPLLGRVAPLCVTFWACGIGTVACLPFAPGLVDEFSEASTDAQLWTVFLGLGPTALGFGAWTYALRHSNAGVLTASLYLVTPIAILLGWVLLGETPPVLAVVGGAICVYGVMITRRKAREPLPPAPVPTPDPAGGGGRTP